MNRKEDIALILLSGGKSTRMGMDKALLDIEGFSFIEKVVKVAGTAVNEILISSNNPVHDLKGALRVSDVKEGQGPLMGLYSCMKASQHSYFLILTCDSPLISEALIQFLLNAHKETYSVSMLTEGNKQYPLIAVYDRQCLATLEIYLNSGKRSVFGFLEKLKVQSIEVPPQFQAQVRNFNRPEDLKYLEKHV